MADHPDRPDEFPDDPVYLNSRREARSVFGAWIVAACVTLSLSFWTGHELVASEVPLLLGMPTWVFWGVLVPWLGCILFAAFFCFVLIKDDDLGEDPDEPVREEDPHA